MTHTRNEISVVFISDMMKEGKENKSALLDSKFINVASNGMRDESALNLTRDTRFSLPCKAHFLAILPRSCLLCASCLDSAGERRSKMEERRETGTQNNLPFQGSIREQGVKVSVISGLLSYSNFTL